MAESLSDAVRDVRARYKGVAGGLLPGVRRIPGLEAARLRSLSEALDALEEECGRLEKMIEDEKASARERGYSEGYRDGGERALALLAESKRVVDEAMQDAKAGIAELAVRIAEKIVAAEIERSPALLGRLIDEAIGEAGRSPGLIVCLNPRDLEGLAAGCRTQIEGTLLTSDPSLPRGGCRIEKAGHSYECGTDVRLERVMDGLCPTGR